jgi:hypothetical protein
MNTPESKIDKFVIEEIVKEMIRHTREGSKSWEMLKTVDNHAHTMDWPVRKLSRWIGYAQCLIIAEGAMSLDDMIKKTRIIENAAKEMFE